MANDGLVDFDIQGNLRDIIQGYPERAFPLIKSAFAKSVFAIHKEVIENTRNKLKRRTGTLAKSLLVEVYGDNLSQLEGRVYSDVEYANVHEYGAEGNNAIKAKNAYRGVQGGPYLNIPLPNNQTPSGVQKFSAKQIFDSGGFIYRSKKGNWLVATAKNGNLQNMFVLKKRVEIKPRLGIRDAIDREMPQMIENMRNAVLEAWG